MPNQQHEKIAVLFKEHFESIAPKSVKVEVSPHHGGRSYVCPIDLPAYQAAEKHRVAAEKIPQLLALQYKTEGATAVTGSPDCLELKRSNSNRVSMVEFAIGLNGLEPIPGRSEASRTRYGESN